MSERIEPEHEKFFNRLTDQARIALHDQVIAQGVPPAERRGAMIRLAWQDRNTLTRSGVVRDDNFGLDGDHGKVLATIDSPIGLDSGGNDVLQFSHRGNDPHKSGGVAMTTAEAPETQVAEGQEGNAPENQTDGATPTFAMQEQLDEWNQNLAALKAEHEAKENPSKADVQKYERAVNLWQGRIDNLTKEIEERRAAEAANPEAASAGTGNQPKGRKPKSGGLPRCPMTGEENKPGSRFKPGMDARLKGMISRVQDNKAEPGFQFPALVIEYATNMPEQMHVAGYTAQDILDCHAKLQRGEGYKAVKPPKDAEVTETSSGGEGEGAAQEPVGASA